MNHNIKIDPVVWAKAKSQAALQGISLVMWMTNAIKEKLEGKRSN
jgi:predicted HicB family RNase H-like nuclease